MSSKPGFGPKANIMTTEGCVPVEWLSTTHRVICRNGPPRKIKNLTRIRQATGRVAVRPSCLGVKTPDDLLVLTPETRVLLSGPSISLNFGIDHALCASGDLQGGRAISVVTRAGSVYEIEMPVRCVIQVNGLWIDPGSYDSAAPYPLLAPWEAQLLRRSGLIDDLGQAAHHGNAQVSGRSLRTG